MSKSKKNYDTLDDWFEQIKENSQKAFELLDNFKFEEARCKIECVLHFCDKIRPHDCSWCGQAHKTENCPLRSEDGGFYHEIEYRIWKDREERVMKQALELFKTKMQAILGWDEYEKAVKRALKKTLLREKKNSKLFDLCYSKNLAEELMEKFYVYKLEEEKRAIKAEA